MTTQTLMQLRQLKLGGMAHALQTQLEQVGTYEGLGFIERLDLLLDQERLSRDQRKQERLIRQARFKLRGRGSTVARTCWSQAPAAAARPTSPVRWAIVPACTATLSATTACHGCCWN
jgi:urease accessory protein UreF